MHEMGAQCRGGRQKIRGSNLDVLFAKPIIIIFYPLKIYHVMRGISWQSSNLCRRAATQHLHFEPCTLHFIKTGHTCPVFIQSIRVWWRQYLLCPLHCAITRRRGFQTIYIDVVRGVGRQIFS